MLTIAALTTVALIALVVGTVVASRIERSSAPAPAPAPVKRGLAADEWVSLYTGPNAIVAKPGTEEYRLLGF